jgi:hypothetical protein
MEKRRGRSPCGLNQREQGFRRRLHIEELEGRHLLSSGPLLGVDPAATLISPHISHLEVLSILSENVGHQYFAPLARAEIELNALDAELSKTANEVVGPIEHGSQDSVAHVAILSGNLLNDSVGAELIRAGSSELSLSAGVPNLQAERSANAPAPSNLTDSLYVSLSHGDTGLGSASGAGIVSSATTSGDTSEPGLALTAGGGTLPAGGGGTPARFAAFFANSGNAGEFWAGLSANNMSLAGRGAMGPADEAFPPPPPSGAMPLPGAMPGPGSAGGDPRLEDPMLGRNRDPIGRVAAPELSSLNETSSTERVDETSRDMSKESRVTVVTPAFATVALGSAAQPAGGPMENESPTAAPAGVESQLEAPWMQFPGGALDGSGASGIADPASNARNPGRDANFPTIFGSRTAAELVRLGAELPSAVLMASLPCDLQAVDQALANMLDEIDDLGTGVASWLGESNLPPWIGLGLGAAACGLRKHQTRRTNRRQPGADEESAWWMFLRLQGLIPGNEL